MNGLSWTNTVTFQSEALDSTSVEMNCSNASGSPLWMINTSRAKHLSFRYMTFTRTLSSGWGTSNNLMIFDMANHITIEHCVFRSHTNLIGKGIMFDRSSNIKVHNCVFKSMYSCLRIGQDANSTDKNVSVQNNRFYNFKEKAFEVYSIEDSLEIKNNYFTNDSLVLSDGQATNTEALLATLCGGMVEIMNNRVEGRYGETAVHVSCMNGTPAYKVKVYNNFIAAGSGFTSGFQGTVALEMYTNNYIDVQYNTINLYNNSWSQSGPYCRGAVQMNATPCYNIRFKNNIIRADSLIGAFFLVPSNWNTTIFSEFDHNDFYYTEPQTTAAMVSAGVWPGGWNANSVSVNPLFQTKNDLHVLNPQLAMGIAVPSAAIPGDIDGELRTHPTVGADEGNFDPINIGSVQTKVDLNCDSAKVFAKVFNFCLDTIGSFRVDLSIDGTLLPVSANWTGILYPGDTTGWIEVGTFPQTNGQVYLVKTHTALPNLATDQFFANDTSGYVFTGSVQQVSIDLGPDLSACFFDTIVLTPQNGLFSNVTWSTSETGQSIQVTASGTYIVTGTDNFNCVSSDTVIVTVSTPVPVILSQSDFTLTASTSLGTTAWYFNNTLIPGETDTILTWTNLGSYHAVLTDSAGCNAYSDTVSVENFRDAGILAVYFDHSCDSTFITVDVKNFGTQPISSLEFEVMVDGTLIPVGNWTGSIASGDTLENLPLGGVSHVFGQLYTVSVRTELPNNGLDSNQPNDEVTTNYQLQQPAFDLGPDLVLCKGENLQIYFADSSGFSDFSWSNGGTNASTVILTGGTYTLEATDTFGCTRTDDIEVIPAGDMNPIISYVNDTLYSSMNTGNQWYLDGILIDNAVGNSLVPSQNGDYTVVYTDQYGCEAESTVYTLTNLGIEEQEDLFELYPNPANQELYVVRNTQQTVVYTILDITGKEVQKGLITSQMHIILLTELESGIYSICFSNSNTMHRFIVKQ
jgi:hypothetical protein